MYNSSTGILAERQYALSCNFSVTQESQSNVFIVFAGFRITQNFGYLFVVRTTQHERNIVECSISHCCQTFLFDFQDRFSFELAYRHIVLCKQIVFSCIFSVFKHRLILEFWCCHNDKKLIVSYYVSKGTKYYRNFSLIKIKSL